MELDQKPKAKIKKYLILAFLFFPCLAHGQGIPFAVNPPAPNAQIYVCGAPAVGSNPCTNQVTIYSNVGLTTVIPQPAQVGPTGNYTFFYSPGVGTLEVQISGRTDQIIPGGASISATTTHAIYATDPTYAGGAKANGHLFIATTNATGGMSALFEMDGTTPYNPVTSGVAIGDYVACVDIFGKSGGTAALELGDGTVASFTATTIQSTTVISGAFVGANCWTGTDDTAALRAAYNSTITIPCGQLELPAGRMLISSQPFLNQNGIGPLCASKIKGQGSSIVSGGGCCQVTYDYGTEFIPTNGFPFSGTGNPCQSIILCDTTNSHGEISNFVILALGMPFTSATSNKNALAMGANYIHDIAIWEFFPGLGATPHAAFSAPTTGVTAIDIAAQGDDLAASVGGQNQTWINTQFGNNANNWQFTNAFDITITGGFEDEESLNTANFINSKYIKFSQIGFLGTAGTFAFTIDGTSSVWCYQCLMDTGAFPEQSVSIAAGGKFTSSGSFYGTGSSTILASIHNLGTYFDNGNNVCQTASFTANNSGGNPPGSCTTGNPPVVSLSHSQFNCNVPVLTSTTTTATTNCFWTPDQNIQIMRFSAGMGTAPSGCSPNAVLTVTNGTNSQTLTISAAQNDSGALSPGIQMVAGTKIGITVSTAASGCGTSPANAAINALWQAGSGT
jgi:hypothetical protein